MTRLDHHDPHQARPLLVVVFQRLFRRLLHLPQATSLAVFVYAMLQEPTCKQSMIPILYMILGQRHLLHSLLMENVSETPVLATL